MKEKAKAEINDILKKHFKKGTYLYGKPIPTHQAVFSVIVEDCRISKSFPYSAFESLLSDFKKNSQKAVDNFFEKSIIPSGTFSIDNFKIKKPKGIQITRGLQWEAFKEIYEVLNNSKGFLLSLIKYKNYLIYKDRQDQQAQCTSIFSSPFYTKKNSPYGVPWSDFGYICQVLGIPYDKYFKDPETKQRVSDINSSVLACIKYLKDALSYIPILIKEKPYTKKWVIDVFGDITIKHYMPDLISSKRKSYNLPNFYSNYKKFIKFINGATSKELGYTSKTYHCFTDSIAPQGIIVLLQKIHELLYGEIDREIAFLQEKINQINDILKDVPPMTKGNILFKLQSDHCKKFPILSKPPKN